MKKTIITMFILFSGLHAGIGSDKYKHAYAGIGIYAGCMLIDTILEKAGHDTILNKKTCLIPVAVAGIGKELYDRKQVNHTADLMDVVATVAIPVGFVTLFEW